MTRQRATVVLWSLAALVALVLGLSWFVPTRDYLYVPNTATPVAAKVKVEGEKPAADSKGGLYYVDVSLRRATWAERLAPFLRPDGSTLVPHDEEIGRAHV